MARSPRDEFALLPLEEQEAALRLYVEHGGSLEVLESTWRGWRARPEQLAPDGDWRFWLMLTGRGFGKTTTATHWVHERVEVMRKGQLGGLLGRTSADVRDIMVTGPDGLLATAPPGKPCKYESSKGRVVFHNGFTMKCFTAEEPDSPIGSSLVLLWVDEFAALKTQTGVSGMTAFDNARLALRGRVRGDQPRGILTTTPRRVKSVKTMLEEAGVAGSNVALTRGSLMDNAHNLDPAYIADILRKYAGTPLGQQEIDGVLATDVEGALFKSAVFQSTRAATVDDIPELGRIVVGVDPSFGDGSGDECGIVVVGISAATIPTEVRHGDLVSVTDQRHVYVLEDASVAAPPELWGLEVSRAAERWGTTSIAAEGAGAQQLIKSVINNVNPALRVKLVQVGSAGKETRAAPVSALFAQGRAHLVGEMTGLEDESTTWVPGSRMASPNRMDAMVHGVAHVLPEAARTNKTYDFTRIMGQRVG